MDKKVPLFHYNLAPCLILFLFLTKKRCFSPLRITQPLHVRCIGWELSGGGSGGFGCLFYLHVTGDKWHMKRNTWHMAPVIWPFFYSIFLSLLLLHICFGPPFLSGGVCYQQGLPCLVYFLVELGLLLQFFAAYIWWEPDQLFIKRNHQTCLKQTKLFLDPI